MDEMEKLQQEQDSDLQTSDAQDLLNELRALESEASEVDGVLNIDSATGESEPAEPEIDTAELLQGIISPLFDVVAPNWGVSYNEKLALSHAYGSLIDKYFPDGVHNKFGVEIAAVMVTVTVFGSRIGVPRVKEEKPVNDAPTEAKKPTEQAPSAPPSGAELGAA